MGHFHSMTFLLLIYLFNLQETPCMLITGNCIAQSVKTQAFLWVLCLNPTLICRFRRKNITCKCIFWWWKCCRIWLIFFFKNCGFLLIPSPSILFQKPQNNWWISNFLESVVAESVVVIKKLLQMQVSFEYCFRELIIYQYLDFALKIKRCG